MVVPHGGILRARTLRWRWLVAHTLVTVGRLRHLPARGQLAPRQLAAAGAQAAAFETAARAAQVPVLHSEASAPAIYPTCAPNSLLINFFLKTTIRPRKRRAARGACVLCVRAPREGSQPHNWMSRDYIELCRLQMVSDPSDSFCRRGEPCARPT